MLFVFDRVKFKKRWTTRNPVQDWPFSFSLCTSEYALFTGMEVSLLPVAPY